VSDFIGMKVDEKAEADFRKMVSDTCASHKLNDGAVSLIKRVLDMHSAAIVEELVGEIRKRDMTITRLEARLKGTAPNE